MSLVQTSVLIRGATVQFATNFFDPNEELVQPDNAWVNIVPSLDSANPVLIEMTAPAGAETRWTALWDTRGQGAPQTIFWSIHTGITDPVPVTAEDGQFTLSANPANLVTF